MNEQKTRALFFVFLEWLFYLRGEKPTKQDIADIKDTLVGMFDSEVKEHRFYGLKLEVRPRLSRFDYQKLCMFVDYTFSFFAQHVDISVFDICRRYLKDEIDTYDFRRYFKDKKEAIKWLPDWAKKILEGK